ncbi:MAG TPA: class I SAM-dependent methyltransferase [Pyrinomonadaceae bacterium]|nr:class I SAM-dependent methyltransferase [Pyrinomonadaceae bacterium]
MTLIWKVKEQPEISDEIVAYDPATLERLPVRKRDVEETFRALGNPRAARIVRAMPERGDALDPEAVDRLLVTVHCEMQRMSEEFQHGRRVFELLSPLVKAVGETRAAPRRLRVVDLGCGTGFVLRWLAAHARFVQQVELIGADYNAALVREAQGLAREESLDCKFVVANAFRLEEPADIFITTGVIHHFRGDALTRLFRQQEEARASAFLHFDFQPSPFAPLGSWLFHFIRMRQPLARHDGVLSAVRAHTAERLLAAAREGAPGFRVSMCGTRLWRTPIPRAFHALVGARPRVWDAFANALGRRASRLSSREGVASRVDSREVNADSLESDATNPAEAS